MITFDSVSFRNFMSYGNNLTTINFNHSGTTLIVGENLDDTSEGIGGNGVGKTTILNVLTYGVYDKPLSNITKDNLVNNINKKNMEVTVNFHINDDHYTIKRERKTKAGAAGNNVYFWINGEDKTLDSAANTNSLIEEIIGIPYEIFVRIVVFSATQIPFLDLSKSEQTNIFEELVGLTTLSDKANLLKEEIKETENLLKLRKVKVDTLEKEHARHDQLVEHAKQRIDTWIIKNSNEIQSLQESLEKLNGVNIDHEQELHTLVADLTTQLKEYSRENKSIQDQINSTSKLITKANNELSHLKEDKCPYCLQQFADANTKMAELESTIEVHTTTTKDLMAQQVNLDHTMVQLGETIQELKQQINVDNIDELLATKQRSDVILARIEDLTVAINPFVEPYEELKSVKLEKIKYDEINNLTKELEHQKFLLKLLTKKDSFIRKSLLNKNIPYLNTRLHHYLTSLGLPHKVEFTHEMTAKISQFSHPLDFGNLSAGQRARVNFALSLAFNDMLQSLHNKINLCMFDEVLDVGLDSVGIQAAIKVLRRKAVEEGTSVYIISHRDEAKGAFLNTMTVQMKKGFSYIAE